MVWQNGGGNTPFAYFLLYSTVGLTNGGWSTFCPHFAKPNHVSGKLNRHNHDNNNRRQ